MVRPLYLGAITVFVAACSGESPSAPTAPGHAGDSSGFNAVSVTGQALAPAQARDSFGFNAVSVTGHINGGEVSLTGGGAYHPSTLFLQAGGSFKCIQTVGGTSPLAGCQAGEGGRWNASELIPSSNVTDSRFRCIGSGFDSQKYAYTDDNTVMMWANFYMRGQGNAAPIVVRMFVSQVDEASDLGGIQNIWVQGVGCGDAIANFN